MMLAVLAGWVGPANVALGVGVVALLWGALVLATAVVAIVRRRRLARRVPRQLADGESARLLLIRPCAGFEPALERCLASVARAHSSLVIEQVIAVADADDAAMPVAQRISEQLTRAGIASRVLVVPPRGPNHKAALLAGVVAETGAAAATDTAGVADAAAAANAAEAVDAADTPPPTIVIGADSNIDLTDYDLDALVAPLSRDGRLAASWAPHAEADVPGSWPNRASVAVLGGSLHAFSLLCALDPAGLVGKLFAVRAEALRAVGGFDGLVEHLGEDFELARRLRRQGFGVTPVPAVARSVAARLGWISVVRRYARWMAVVRAQRPWLMLTYPLLFCGTPLVIVMAAAVRGHPGVMWGAVAAAVVGRLVVALAARVFSGRGFRLGGALLDALLADGVLLAAFVRASLTRRIVWRNRALRIGRGGLLCEEERVG